MIPLEQARAEILAALQSLPAETIGLTASPGRVAAEDVPAVLDVPAFDNASVDGYAVRSQDLATAEPGRPIAVRIVGQIAAGEAPRLEVVPGTCARIFTGAVIPAGADAVIMQEDVRLIDPGTLETSVRAAPWEGVRFVGEDLRKGHLLVRAGQRLRPVHVGLLASGGIASLPVHRRPRVTVLSSGSELTELGEIPSLGKIPDSNGPLLHALATADGAEVVGVRRVPDALDATLEALHQAARESDVVVTTGGVSVGDADFLKSAISEMGGALHFWRIALKPGKPFAWGQLGSVHWFGLPGNPVSAFVTWRLLVRPALRRLEGDQELFPRKVGGRLAEALENRGDRLQALRVTMDATGLVRTAGTQASHIQSGLAAADGLLLMPPATAWEAGRTVEIERLD